ncbi:MAG: hypothetical protein RL456_2039 [Pseudomonadota bacterium]|jgi:hypothetical protein
MSGAALTWRWPAALAVAGLAVAALTGRAHLGLPAGGAEDGRALVEQATQARLAADGRALWQGEWALTARLAGDAAVLPVQASRCVNCHGEGATGPDAGARPAPALHRAHLLDGIARRGGPPSRYDEAAFCRLLRTGVDPAAVLLPRAMPRYELGDADCAALWAHLTRFEGAAAPVARR